MNNKKKIRIIKHELMEPYFIQVTENSYDTCKLVNSKEGKVSKALSFHSSVTTALKDIIDRKSKEFEGEIYLSEYVKKLEKLNNQILNINN